MEQEYKMTWIKTAIGGYINIDEMEGIGLSDIDSYGYRVTMKSGDV
ncbi:hypothetical protein HYT23_03445 [Candidatus Pacearchaeota archaeon]|nr:hypothetical protein [Candidatus Pacearchaeota archaeon]